MTKYFDIESTLDKYSESPRATKFLFKIIDRSSPDAFHQFDVDRARALKALDLKENKI